jgi:pseudaminic acid synthase
MKNAKDDLLFIAEVSANHLGSLNRAIKIVEAAAENGANAIKFQTYTADTMTINSKLLNFRVSDEHSLWGGRSLYDLYQEAFTPWEWHKELFELCRRKGVIPFSSPFDITAVDFLESIDSPMYKVASLETGDHTLIRKIAQTGKPMIISTGATTFSEIQEFMQVILATGNSQVTLLVCTSAYPSEPTDAHISRIKTLKDAFGVRVGLSDHTLGIGVSIAAIALGASAIEKHITLKRTDGGADAAFSLEPKEFGNLVKEGRAALDSIGNPNWNVLESEKESRRLRRSLYVVEDVRMGDLVTPFNIRSIRPGGGAPPKLIDSFLGKFFSKDTNAGTPLSYDLIKEK